MKFEGKGGISAEIICDSLGSEPLRGQKRDRLTTMVIRYPRFILGEVNTHRALSKNSASSRAIPVSKMLARVMEDPALPVFWGLNKSGMQANEEASPEIIAKAIKLILDHSLKCIDLAEALNDLGLHKQIVNRYTEPFHFMETIITGTEWGNFFNLRSHKDAQPEFQELAFTMLKAYALSEPTFKFIHLPFGDRYLDENLSKLSLVKISVARCARVSYLNFNGFVEHEKDYALYDMLLKSGHMSPFEHVAYAGKPGEPVGNLVGWCSHRKTLPNENRSKIDILSLYRDAGRKIPEEILSLPLDRLAL